MLLPAETRVVSSKSLTTLLIVPVPDTLVTFANVMPAVADPRRRALRRARHIERGGTHVRDAARTRHAGSTRERHPAARLSGLIETRGATQCGRAARGAKARVA